MCIAQCKFNVTREVDYLVLEDFPPNVKCFSSTLICDWSEFDRSDYVNCSTLSLSLFWLFCDNRFSFAILFILHPFVQPFLIFLSLLTFYTFCFYFWITKGQKTHLKIYIIIDIISCMLNEVSNLLSFCIYEEILMFCCIYDDDDDSIDLTIKLKHHCSQKTLTWKAWTFERWNKVNLS